MNSPFTHTAPPVPEQADDRPRSDRRRFLFSLPALGALSLPGCGGSGGGGGGGPPPASPPATPTLTPWQQAVAAFDANIRSTHPDPRGIAASATWRAAIDLYHNQAPTRTDKANLLELQRLAALMRDEHTVVYFPANALLVTPVRFSTASDGIWVQQAPQSLPSILGARLVSIDGVAVDALRERVAPFISAATTAWRDFSTPPQLHQVELLGHAGVGNGRESRIVVKETSGVEREVLLSAGDATPLLAHYARPGGVPAPLWLSQPDRRNFFTTLPDGVVYVRYASCSDDPAEPVSTFFQRVINAINAQPRRRAVFDLRNNPGGNSALLSNPLNNYLASVPSGQRATFAALLNNGTLSSAAMNTFELAVLAGARTFGEPPGTAPNHTGNTREFKLPGTGSVHITSTQAFVLDPARGEANYTPDVVVAPTVADRVAGLDPVLTRALAYLNA